MTTSTTEKERATWRRLLKSAMLKMPYTIFTDKDLLRLLDDADIAEELSKGRCVASKHNGDRCLNQPMVDAPVCAQHWHAVAWAKSRGPKK